MMIETRYLVLILIVILLVYLWICYNFDQKNKNNSKDLIKLSNSLRNTVSLALPIDRIRCGTDVASWNIYDVPDSVKCGCSQFYKTQDGVDIMIEKPSDIQNGCINVPESELKLNYPYNVNILYPGRVIYKDYKLYSENGKICLEYRNGWFGTYLLTESTTFDPDTQIFSFGMYNTYIGLTGDIMVMTTEGDLQIYNNNNLINPIWSMSKDMKKTPIEKSYAYIDNDGRIKVKTNNGDLVWQSERSLLVPGGSLLLDESLIKLVKDPNYNYFNNTIQRYYRLQFSKGFDGQNVIENQRILSYSLNEYKKEDPYNPYYWVSNINTNVLNINMNNVNNQEYRVLQIFNNLCIIKDTNVLGIDGWNCKEFPSKGNEFLYSLMKDNYYLTIGGPLESSVVIKNTKVPGYISPVVNCDNKISGTLLSICYKTW
jgi:hypothetical protein